MFAIFSLFFAIGFLWMCNGILNFIMDKYSEGGWFTSVMNFFMMIVFMNLIGDIIRNLTGRK
jgi:hypothetical protein